MIRICLFHVVTIPSDFPKIIRPDEGVLGESGGKLEASGRRRKNAGASATFVRSRGVRQQDQAGPGRLQRGWLDSLFISRDCCVVCNRNISIPETNVKLCRSVRAIPSCHVMSCHVMSFHILSCLHRGMVWHGIAWHGIAWHGIAWHGRHGRLVFAAIIYCVRMYFRICPYSILNLTLAHHGERTMTFSFVELPLGWLIAITAGPQGSERRAAKPEYG